MVVGDEEGGVEAWHSMDVVVMVGNKEGIHVREMVVEEVDMDRRGVDVLERLEAG